MSTAVERTNFIGKNVPAEVKLLIKLSRKTEIKKFQEIVSGIYNYTFVFWMYFQKLSAFTTVAIYLFVG